jgi:ubiquinone/menaquinone biosynthesis C-methylase UbiE
MQLGDRMEPKEIISEKEELVMKEQLEKMVDTYDSYMNKITFGREKLLREETLNKTGIKLGDRVLEVGSGTGTLALAAKKKVGLSGKVNGIDVIPGMIAVSKQKAKQANEEVSFDLGSIADIPFETNTFDIVICSFMIFHIAEKTRQKGISEIRRVLKPKGKVFIVDLGLPQGSIQRIIAKIFFGFMINHEVEELTPSLKENGFIEIMNGKVGFKMLGLSIISYVCGIARK